LVKFCGTKKARSIRKLLYIKFLKIIKSPIEDCVLSDLFYDYEDMVNHDQIIQNIKVFPEGIKQDFTHSVYFCPNERIKISTPAKYSPKFVKKPKYMDSFTFSVKTKSDVIIILADVPNSPTSFKILLGYKTNLRLEKMKNFSIISFHNQSAFQK
jgi:hypothetical protein